MLEKKQLRFKVSGYVMMMALWAILGILGMSHAQAYDVSGVPTWLNDTLFGGGTDLTPAKVLLSSLVALAFILPMSIVHVDFRIQLILITIILGFLTAVQWLDAWIFLVVVLLVIVFFVSKATDVIWPGGAH
jgi:hypothetical protein